jgi:hypothetical protein
MLYVDSMFLMLYLGILFSLSVIVRWEYLRWQAQLTAREFQTYLDQR